jgi:hypothetical protein
MSLLEEPKLVIGETAFEHLKNVRRWAALCSLIVIACLGITVALVMVGTLDTGPDTTMIIFGVFALAYILPFIYLYRFADQAKIAVVQHDSFAFESALKFLKWHYCTLAIVFLMTVIGVVAAFIGLFSKL